MHDYRAIQRKPRGVRERMKYTYGFQEVCFRDESSEIFVPTVIMGDGSVGVGDLTGFNSNWLNANGEEHY